MKFKTPAYFDDKGKKRVLEKKESSSHTLEAEGRGRGRGRGRGTQFILPAIAHRRFSIFLKTMRPTSLYLSHILFLIVITEL